MAEKKNLRSSRQREIILEELRKLKSHPTAEALYKLVSKRMPKISLGTIYRNLDLLSKQKIIHKIEVGGFRARFDGDTDNHYHIYCTNCGKINDVDDFSGKIINIELSKIKGYTVEGYHMNFYGICSDCRKNH